MIDYEGPVPLYQQLAEILRGQIADGTLRPKRPVPSITHLQQQYSLARGTVTKALAILVAEGLIYSVRGRGMYVVDKPPPT